MTVLVFLVYFYTVLVIERKTKFSTKSPRKYAILTPKSKKKIGEGVLPPPQTLLSVPLSLAPSAPRLGSRLRHSFLAL